MYKGVIRLTSLLVLLFNINQTSVLAQGMFKVKGKIGKKLPGCNLMKGKETNMERCMAKCLEDCLCLSFQMCEVEGCELCPREGSPSAFHENKGCTHYAFQKRSGVKNQHCKKECSTEINCCITSNPCKNNGTCEPTSFPTDATTRFRCKN